MNNRILRSLCALALAGAVTSAGAYNQGGHYDTVVTLLDRDLAEDPELALETFCTEIPDLAREFDATTQRVLVFLSPRDLLWGAIGYCQTPRSSHMVASQYYLHGLSGAPTDKVREAAREIVGRIDLKRRDTPPQERAARQYLACARGMAIHLFGDSFAHSRFTRETPPLWPWSGVERQMYATGLGHARDGMKPDYLYAHTHAANMWPRLALETSELIPPNGRLVKVLSTHKGCNARGAEGCESDAVEALKALNSDRNNEAIGKMAELFEAGKTGIGGMERAKLCQQVFDEDAPARLDCEALWKIYLQFAVPVFRDLGIDPTDRTDAVAGASCSAWQCADPGASRASCDVEITDEVSKGR